MRTVEQVKSTIPDVVAAGTDHQPKRPLDITVERFHFILAACEDKDDMDEADWQTLFEACKGKTEEEIVKIARSSIG